MLVLALALDIEPERPLAAIEQQLRGAMALRFADALANPIALVLSNSAQDREHQLADAVARHVAAEVEHVQGDPLLAEVRDDVGREASLRQTAIR